MINKFQQISKSYNYPYQINNFFVLSNATLSKVSSILSKLRSQNRVEIIDKETFYNEVHFAKLMNPKIKLSKPIEELTWIDLM